MSVSAACTAPRRWRQGFYWFYRWCTGKTGAPPNRPAAAAVSDSSVADSFERSAPERCLYPSLPVSSGTASQSSKLAALRWAAARAPTPRASETDQVNAWESSQVNHRSEERRVGKDNRK